MHHSKNSPVATPHSTIPLETCLDLVAHSVQSSSESHNQTSQKAILVRLRSACGRKVHRHGTRGVVLALGLGRVTNTRTDATKQSHNDDVN